MPETLLGFNTKELANLLAQEGEPAYRGRQLAEWIYLRGVHTFQEMDNLPPVLRSRLDAKYKLGRSHIVASQRDKDGTTKLLLEMSDGVMVEVVSLPYSDRLSCCVSTQAGCPIACIFCATGLSGFKRHLTAGEIIDQVLHVQETGRIQLLHDKTKDVRIDHVTFMGMGEPLLNYESTLKALLLLNKELGISMRHLTVSTAGFVPGIRKLAHEKLQITLAVSLHASGDALRNRLIPGMSKWSLAQIMDACSYYFRETGRRVTFEYCLLDGINDSEAEARKLAELLKELNCHVNLIPYNPVSGINFSAPRKKNIQIFRRILEEGGINVTQRVQRGSGIDAACGQLRQHIENDYS